MRTVKVPLADRSYPIRIGSGLLADLGPWEFPWGCPMESLRAEGISYKIPLGIR